MRHTKGKRVIALMVGAAVVGSMLFGGSGTAGASTPNSWAYYTTDSNPDAEIALWRNAWGAVTATGYFDTNNNGAWDTYVNDWSGDGIVDTYWFDRNEDGYWDTMIEGNQIFEYRGGRNGLCFRDGSGNCWGNIGWLYTTIRPISLDRNTTVGAMNNLVVSLARHTGNIAW